jgi:hypothetical protein
MNDTTDDLDRTDEETIACKIADEALEAAAGTGRGMITAGTWGGPYPCAPAEAGELMRINANE